MAQVKLFGAVASEDEMGMRVNKPRQHSPPTRSVSLACWDSGKVYGASQRLLRPHPDDVPITRGHRPPLNDP